MNRLSGPIERRDWLKHIAIASAGAAMGSTARRCTSAEPAHYDLMRDVMKYRKLDAHDHIGLSKQSLETQIEWAERLGIERMAVSKPVTRGQGPPEEVRSANDQIIESIKKYPDNFVGLCFVNAAFPKEALGEIDRCIDAGMVGLKAYTQVKINDSFSRPIHSVCDNQPGLRRLETRS